MGAPLKMLPLNHFAVVTPLGRNSSYLLLIAFMSSRISAMTTPASIKTRKHIAIWTGLLSRNLCKLKRHLQTYNCKPSYSSYVCKSWEERKKDRKREER